jgi:hypothetical protein
MFDNLRDQGSAGPVLGDEAGLPSVQDSGEALPRVSARTGRLFGMTPAQRLAIAFLLLIAVCVLGAMCLLVTGRIGGF